MKRSLLALSLALSLSLTQVGARASDPDPWTGPDKTVHFAASAAIASGGYAVGAIAWDDRGRPLVLGAALGVAAGAGKEAADLMGLGHPSFRDLAWDGLGVAFGLVLAWSVDLVVRGVSSEHPAFRSPCASSSGLRVAF